MKRLLHVALATLMALPVATVSAQLPTDGGTYRLQYAADGKVMTNGDIVTHDAPLILAEVDDASAGQQWTFYLLDATAGTYLIYNHACGQAADMALSSSNPGKLLQWEPTCSGNHIFQFRSEHTKFFLK